MYVYSKKTELIHHDLLFELVKLNRLKQRFLSNSDHHQYSA